MQGMAYEKRNNLVTVRVGPAAADDDAEVVGTALTTRQEIFARVLAETGNKNAAYRRAYNVGENVLLASVWASASRIAANPLVKARVWELMQQAALETVMNIRTALQWQVDIATADPNEIAYTAKRACRNCYGFEHAYQWKDEAEYIAACVEAIDGGKQPPTDSGGYGYTRAREPVLTCPECLGDGVPEIVVNDTTKLTGKARKLYKGMDYKNGQWVVTMHDQAKAWEMACRMLGAFNDKLDLRTPAERSKSAAIADDITEQDASRAYLALLG